MNKTHENSFIKCFSFIKNKINSFKNKEKSNKEKVTEAASSTSIQISVNTTNINNSSIYMSSFIPMSDNKVNTTSDNNIHIYFNDYSKYNYNIISSLIDTMIDAVETRDHLNHKKDKHLQDLHIFYNKQHDFSELLQTFDTSLCKEFEEIITNILSPSPDYLIRLYEIKIYSGDLQNTYTRHGVFGTNNFIIKIDDNEDTIVSELSVMYSIGKGTFSPYNIVLPYYVHNADDDSGLNGNTKDTKDTKDTKNTKESKMSFSIQPRIKNTTSLHMWMQKFENRFYDVTYYIKLCITISKSILYIHSHNLVHGDIKPENILMELSTNVPYIIDFGLSGIHGVSQGTGGTRPFCCPETNNTTIRETNSYIWSKNNKNYDLWSIAFIFSTIIIFKKSYHHYSDYPMGYFDHNKYVNPYFLKRIPLLFREAFMLVLCKKSDINLSNFILLLEEAISQYQLPGAVAKESIERSDQCGDYQRDENGSIIMRM